MMVYALFSTSYQLDNGFAHTIGPISSQTTETQYAVSSSLRTGEASVLLFVSFLEVEVDSLLEFLQEYTSGKPATSRG